MKCYIVLNSLNKSRVDPTRPEPAMKKFLLLIACLLFSGRGRKKTALKLDIFKPTEIKALPITNASHTSVHLILWCHSLLRGGEENGEQSPLSVAKRIYLSGLVSFTRRRPAAVATGPAEKPALWQRAHGAG